MLKVDMLEILTDFGIISTCFNIEPFQHFNVSILIFQHFQRFGSSTFSAFQYFNLFSISTFQHFNSSTISTVSTCSTFQHFNISRFQHFNMFNISTFQLPLKAKKCSTFQCLTSALKVEGSDSNASRFWSQIRELAGWPGLAESCDF